MTRTVLAYYIEIDNGRIGPAWTLEGALEQARDAETGGRTAIRIVQGADTVLEGDELRKRLGG